MAIPTEAVVRVLDPEGSELERWALHDPSISLGAVTHIGWTADTLWVADAWRRRVVFLPPGGDAPRVHEPSAPQLARGEIEGAPYDGEDPDLQIPLPLARGRWLSIQRAAPAIYPVRLENEPARRALVVLDSDERLYRALGFLRPGPWRVEVEEPGAPIDPMRDHPLYALSPDGSHVTVVERSLERAVWMDIYTVTRFSLEGDTLFRVERPPPLLRPSGEALSMLAGEISEYPAFVEAFPWANVRPSLVRASMYSAPFHPPISDVVVGTDGTTWLRWPDASDGPVRWDVLDPEGRPLRTLMLDRRARIVGATGDAVWALLPDSDGGTGLRAVRYDMRVTR